MKQKTKSRTLASQVADAKKRGHMRNDLPSPAMVPVVPLEIRVKELEHDFLAVARLLGDQFGEPIKSKVMEIVTKRQT